MVVPFHQIAMLKRIRKGWNPDLRRMYWAKVLMLWLLATPVSMVLSGVAAAGVGTLALPREGEFLFLIGALLPLLVMVSFTWHWLGGKEQPPRAVVDP